MIDKVLLLEILTEGKYRTAQLVIDEYRRRQGKDPTIFTEADLQEDDELEEIIREIKKE